jgi:hypothetical protein
VEPRRASSARSRPWWRAPPPDELRLLSASVSSVCAIRARSFASAALSANSPRIDLAGVVVRGIVCVRRRPAARSATVVRQPRRERGLPGLHEKDQSVRQGRRRTLLGSVELPGLRAMPGAGVRIEARADGAFARFRWSARSAAFTGTGGTVTCRFEPRTCTRRVSTRCSCAPLGALGV